MAYFIFFRLMLGACARVFVYTCVCVYLPRQPYYKHKLPFSPPFPAIILPLTVSRKGFQLYLRVVRICRCQQGHDVKPLNWASLCA